MSKTFKERCHQECTRDAIFLFQRKVINIVEVPYGWEWGDESFNMVEEDADLATDKEVSQYLDHYKTLLNEAKDYVERPYISYKEMYDRMVEQGLEGTLDCWETESVWLTREEATIYAHAKHYNYPHGWRVYCVCAEGELAKLIKET